MAKFTIGIPTYNRAEMLRTAIKAALSQSHGDVEVIVCDNASSDNTPQVAAEFGNRVRYVRNPANLGASANFCRLVELATGEYFSWLQDDDCVFAPFAARAVTCFERFPRATVYGAYAVVSGSTDYLANGWLYGPPLKLDWAGQTPLAVPTEIIAPLSLCVTVAMPPVVAFRTDELKQCLPRWNHAIPLLVERTIVAEAAALGEAVFDPFVAGVFRSHPQQGYRVMQAADPRAQRQQWTIMARQLDALVNERDVRWHERLSQMLLEVPEHHRRAWERESRAWPADIGLCQAMRSALQATVPQELPQRIPLSPSGLARAGARAARALLAKVLA